MTKQKNRGAEYQHASHLLKPGLSINQNRSWFNRLEHAVCFPFSRLLKLFLGMALFFKKCWKRMLDSLAQIFLIAEINRLGILVAKQPAVRSLRGKDAGLKPSTSAIKQGNDLSNKPSDKAVAEPISDSFCSWPGLTDKTFNARALFSSANSASKVHQADSQKNQVHERPDLDALAALFVRPEGGKQIDAERSSMLFPFFARWFTDSFMRIDTRDKRKNTSNHDIDLCQIYGLNECDTWALREHRGGRLRSRFVNASEGCSTEKRHGNEKHNASDEYPDLLFRRYDAADAFIQYPDCLCKRCSSVLPLAELSKRCLCDEHAGAQCSNYDCQHESSVLAYIYGNYIVKEEFRPLVDHHLALTGACCLAAYFKLLFRFIADERKSDDELVATMYASGLERGNASAGYTMFSTLFLRQHNRICRQLIEDEGFVDDEKIFQTARMINTLILLKLVVVSYVRHIGDMKGSWGFYPEKLCTPTTWFRRFRVQGQWFKKNWVSLEFNLLYRWHSLIPERFVIGGNTLDMRSLFHNNAALESFGLEGFFEAASTQSSGKICLKNTPAYLFNAEKSSLDLVYKNALPTYNEYRLHYGLKPYSSVAEMCGDATLTQAINQAYGDKAQDQIEKVDLYVGLFAEKTMIVKKREGYKKLITGDKLFGELMYRMVAGDAFSHLYGNPLLCEEVINASVLTETGLKELTAIDCFESLLLRNSSNKRVFASFDFTS